MKGTFKYIISLVLILSVVMVMVSGGTFAYYSWQGNEEQRTEIVFTLEQEFWCAADGGGNITSEDIVLAPADCTNSKYAIQREIKVMPTILGEHTILMDLWLNINEIGDGLSNSTNFKYALTTSSDSCTDGLVKAGNFYGKGEGDSVPLLTYNGYTTTTVETYYLYVWLDAAETSADTMYQSVSLSLDGSCTNAPEPQTYVVYNEEDSSLRLYKRDSTEISNSINNSYVSLLDNRNINDYNIETMEDSTATEDNTMFIDLENTVYSASSQLPWYEYMDSITKVIIEDEISPINISYWFRDMKNVSYMDLSKLDASRITNMSYVFNNTGYNASTFEIVGLDYWNTSNVTNMRAMFYVAGRNATTWSIGDLSDWDVSNVTNMENMFASSGYSATTWSIGDLSGWDVSNVTTMYSMFNNAGYSVINLFELNVSNWDVSNVTTIQNMFTYAGCNAKKVVINVSNWDILNLTNMFYTFQSAGNKSDDFKIIGLYTWNVSSVTNISYMFHNTGSSATIFDIGDLSDWNVSNVTNMNSMFFNTGSSAMIFDIGDLSDWNVSNVTNMRAMFSNAGYNANYTMDLSGWDVSNVTSYTNFNNKVTNKITPPVWVN